LTAINVGGQTVVDAWREGAALVLRSGEVGQLITTVESPCILDRAWLDDNSPRRLGRKHDDIRDVVDTIFPIDLAERYADDRQEFFDRYLRLHDRAKRWKRNRGTWGTYFERLIRFPLAESVNQLDRAIHKLSNWPVRNTTGIVFHLSSPAFDAPRTRGGPCWHFGELLWNHDGSLDLVAVYRNHDFMNKALGNFVALGQLLGFICRQSGKRPGTLICHSVHAYRGGTASALRTLLG
jgi:thymidylate synthase